MKDPQLEAYCDEIESFFFRWKERPGTLSPRDFRRVKEWYEAGVPVEAVLDGISEAFRAQQGGRTGGVEEVNSLGYCEGFVRRAVEQKRGL